MSGEELTTDVTLSCFVVLIEILQYAAKALIFISAAQLRALQQRLLSDDLLDKEIAKLHLADNSVHKRVSKNDYQVHCRRLNDALVSVGKAAGLDERFLNRLEYKPNNCRLPK